MDTSQIGPNMNFPQFNLMNNLFNKKRAEILEATERELDLFEFGLFVAAKGKKSLDKALAGQKAVRKIEKQRKADFSEIDKMAEKF